MYALEDLSLVGLGKESGRHGLQPHEPEDRGEVLRQELQPAEPPREMPYLPRGCVAPGVSPPISLILPFITQSVVDTGIGTGNMSFIVMLLVAQLILVMGQMCNNLIRSWLMLHMTTRVSISMISDFPSD